MLFCFTESIVLSVKVFSDLIRSMLEFRFILYVSC